ncbi:MAG TPA: DUF72 domain-containing protein [Bryobacteraceae bacterium]|jgi:uncharacterized protein YecE (DUF72 family)|nr:DUF72 domain-containing protein [Bryobacteraceae bacterium]
MAQIWIGTSGWHYKHWLGNFYPPRLASSRMLAHYVEKFDTVELNNTFYKLPTPTSLMDWRDSTPPHFHFAVKGSRFLTHMKKLKNAEDGLRRFLNAVEVLGPKLGPILFQLPPNWELDFDRLAAFLAILPRYHRCAFEFRNITWNTPQIYDLLAQYNAAYCIFDLAGYLSPVHVTANFAYIRLHGPGGKYQGSYSDPALRKWAQKIRAWDKKLAAVYVYFDNDDSGYAPKDALRLKNSVRMSNAP